MIGAERRLRERALRSPPAPLGVEDGPDRRLAAGRAQRRRARSALALLTAALAGPSCSTPPPARDAIHIAVPYELTTLDPHAEDRLGVFAVLSNVYEPLVTTDADMKVQPCLATAWETPDPLDWVFHLRPGANFHDGRPIEAKDVVYSFQRLLRDPRLEIRNYLANVVDVTAPDRLTVHVRTERPTRILLSKVSKVLIVAEGVVGATLAGAANGTGPYRLTSWLPGKTVGLTRYDGHWGLRPAVREVEFVLGQGAEPAILGLQQGRYQLVQADSKKVVALLGGSSRYRVLRRDNIFVKFLGFDLARDVTPFCSARPNPFRDRRVRQALHIGLDRHHLVRELWNYAVPAVEPVPRFVFGFSPDVPEPATDRERARELLRSAGLGSGFEVTMHARRIVAEAAAFVREDLASLGIRAQVKVMPDGEFFELLNARRASFWLSRFGCPSGDASDFLDAMVHSPTPDGRYGLNNYGGYRDPELDRAIEASAGLDKPNERRNALQQIVRRVTDELVIVPLYNDQDVYALESSLTWQPRSDSFIHAATIGVQR